MVKNGGDGMMFFKKKKPTIDTSIPNHWALSWSGTIELGFPDGKYLPRKAALIIYPQYFKDGEPILDMLPIDEPKGKI